MTTKTKKTDKGQTDPHLNDDDLNPLGLPFEGTVEDEEPEVKSIATQLGEERADFLRTKKGARTVAQSEGADALERGVDTTTAAAIAALQREVESLREALARTESAVTPKADDDGGPGGYPYMYYKRSEDGGPMSGWIIYANGGASPRTGQRDTGTYGLLLSKGYKALPRYGIADPPASYPRPGSRYIPFLLKGGAKEVPASQVLALKWHLKPPLAGTVFPQYEKIKETAQNFVCDEGDCPLDMWFLPDDQTTASACLTHLKVSHDYKHREAVAALRDQGIYYRQSKVREAAERALVGRVAAELEDDDE